MNVTWDELIVRYANAAIRAEVKYRDQKQLFDAISAAYTDRVDRAADTFAMVNAASRAADDPRRKDAAQKAAWFRDEATMYASMAQMAALVAARERDGEERE